MSGVHYRPEPRSASAWSGWIGTQRSLLKPGFSKVRPAITSGAVRLIPSLIPKRSLAEQFNQLRDVDNLDYPTFAEIKWQRYEMHIRPAAEIKQSSVSPSPSA